MGTNSYRFKLGKFECVSICDGSSNYPLQNFFANVPKAQVEAALQQCNLPIDFITTPDALLYVNTSEQRVLVDMGAGDLAPTTGRLLQNMRATGIDPAGIDTVIITHAHPEQVGGTLDDQGKPIYTNAHYYMWKKEWEFWFSEIAFSKTPEHFVIAARKNLEPIQDQLTLLDRESELMPGIRVMTASGHTPGHIVVSFSSGDEQLLFASDTVLYPLHLEHPDWTPIYDILPEEAAVSKRRIFDLAAEQQVLVIGHHFPPFPSLGYIVKQGVGWRWHPVEAIEAERSLE
jgi:glyoxylase-like metal-dependent hydrolase (beta-lactamase superfamily II)